MAPASTAPEAPSGGLSAAPAPVPPTSSPRAPSGLVLHDGGPSQPADTAPVDSPAQSSSDQAPGVPDSVFGSSAAMAPASPSTSPPAPQRPTTRLLQGIRKPKTYTDGTIRYAHLTAVAEEPSSLKDALANPNWKLAMDVEFDALLKNKTWHLVPPAKGRNVIDCKWVYKVKKKADGSIDRYKVLKASSSATA